MPQRNKGNPVSDKSKQWMESALLKLMETEHYHEITIQEITDHAGLSRRTFYRNYTSKEEILEGRFYKIWQDYRADIVRQTDLSLPHIAEVFFTHMQKHKTFLTIVHRHRLLPLFLAKVDELLPSTFKEVRGELLPFSKESIAYALTFSSGGFLRLLIRWLDDGAVNSPEEMAAIIKDFIAICGSPTVPERPIADSPLAGPPE